MSERPAEEDCITCCVEWWRDAALTSWVAQPLAGAWHKEISARWREPGEEEPKKGSKHSYSSVRGN